MQVKLDLVFIVFHLPCLLYAPGIGLLAFQLCVDVIDSTSANIVAIRLDVNVVRKSKMYSETKMNYLLCIVMMYIK